MMAIKRVPILNFIKDGKENIRLDSLISEIRILSVLSHQNIVKYLGHHNDENHKVFNIFLEYIPGGSIYVLLRKYEKFNETLTSIYTRHILLGLSYLHSKGIVHRDIKGGNILVGNDGVCKLADFGGAKYLLARNEDSSKQERMFQGTIQWTAPEVLQGSNKQITSQADIWSVGCTVLEMLTGLPPNWDNEKDTITLMNLIAKTTKLPEFPEDISEVARDFLLCCIN
jgi:serine/threonine protein kinase